MKIKKMICSLLLTIMASAAAAGSASAEVPSDAKKWSKNGHYYKVFNKSVTWEKAKAYCENQGGYLATITSKKEHDYIVGLIEKSKSKSFFWLGATDRAEEGKWKWITGEKWNYTNWGNGQPDNYGSKENALQIVNSKSGWYQYDIWNDADGTLPENNLGFVCEWKSKADAIKLTQKTASVEFGKTITLKFTTAKKVTWKSSNKSVATVSNKGVVTGKKPGTATITATLNGKKYSCKVTVKNPSVKASSLSFKTSDSGLFISGYSSALVKFKLPKSVTDVTVSVKNSGGTTVHQKKYGLCKAKTEYSFTWNGKDTKGKNVKAGTYKVTVKAGTRTTTSKTLIVRNQDFAGGTGSKKNPFQVNSLQQFLKVENYNGYYFKQTANINGNRETISGIYSEDNPFVGTYDGQGYSISNLTIRNSAKAKIALIGGVGEKGTLKNMNLNQVNVIGNTYYSGLVFANNGKIMSCSMTGCNLTGNAESQVASVLCAINNAAGQISDCTVTNCVIKGSASRGNCDMGILVCDNHGELFDSTITGSELSGYVEDYFRTLNLGAIAKYNTAVVDNCMATNTKVVGTKYAANAHINAAGISQWNEGTITNTSFSGEADYQGVAGGNGIFWP